MDYAKYEHNPTAERIVDVLMKKNGSIHDALFYRVITAFYMAKIASMMRCSVVKYDKQVIPVNVYALNLMPSGMGKGLSTNILERSIFGAFREKFLNDTFPMLATENVHRLAAQRAVRDDIPEDEALEAVGKEFTQLGQLMFSFDSGTPAALKQMRLKLLMANAGSMNFHIDEIGSNLQKNQDMLETFLELFDIGTVKQKLIKNTAENTRLEDMEGITPANLLMFGTPVKLLDGGKTEELLMDFLVTGYGRRCFFGLVEGSAAKRAMSQMSPEEYLDSILNSGTEENILSLSDYFADFAAARYFNIHMTLPREVAIECLRYRAHCQARSEAMPPHDDIGKAEMFHREFKAMKLAGAYAFCEGRTDISMANLFAAIRLAEESGEAFRRIMARERNYVRLAKYIASAGSELTQADLVEDLPFYRGTNAVKNEMMQLATAWGYKQNIIIQKKYNEGIEFFSGSMLAETDVSKMILSHSHTADYEYDPVAVPFTRFHEMTQLNNYHFTNHHLKGGHRLGANAIKGFNWIGIDVDGTCTVETAQLLLKDYTYHMYTTKSHNKPGKGHRFRIIMPISHVLHFTDTEYREFMSNLFEWLPFDSDEQTGQRVCKWACNPGAYWYNEGKLIDALPFIPATTKNEERKEAHRHLTHFGNIERWFALRMVDGQRSNEMVKFALLLVDSGMPIEDVEEKVIALNDKLKDPLPNEELGSTILRTATKRFLARRSHEAD